MKAWQSKLVEQSTIRDVFTGLAGTYIGKTQEMPNSMIIDVSSQAKPGIDSVTIPLIMDLSGAGRIGRQSLLTYEEDQAVKFVTLYANNVKHAVPIEVYGIDAWHKKGYNLVGRVQPQLSKWHNEKEGLYMREAFCEGVSSNLVVAPTSQSKYINKNVYIIDTVVTKVAYSATLATFRTAIDSAVPTTPTAAHQINIDALNQIARILSVDEAMEPVERNGKDAYYLFIPSNQAQLLRDSTDSNQLAALYRDSDVRGDGNKAINGELGVYNNMILIEDPRAPRVEVDTTVTFGYKGPGTTDTRGAVGVTEFDVIMASGKGSMGKLTFEKLHFETEKQDYNSINGIGAVQTYGYQLIEFDDETPGDTTRINQNSALFLAASKLA
jgi:hypothetical protein